jgi:hypothetical protein
LLDQEGQTPYEQSCQYTKERKKKTDQHGLNVALDLSSLFFFFSVTSDKPRKKVWIPLKLLKFPADFQAMLLLFILQQSI